MGDHSERVELLAPAGSREAFVGAINAGADAVYLGGEKFGARAYADNFSDREIVRAIEEAHIFGRKVYLTANILTRESELADLTSFVSELYRAGLDGVIVQDLGVLSALREACPGLPLHASTQMSVTASESVRYLRRLGVSRVVPARELSLREIDQLRREDAEHSGRPVEIEAFIHGAMCYSYSGRCLMSSFLGGRSGNRGRCAGTCRLPARILDEEGRAVGPDARKKELYPLSMKDMCVLQILPELIDAGICSFKIEGRMKKPVYAAGVTAIYRKYIDRCYAWMESGRKTPWTVEEEDLEKLRALYIRTSLGTGYYHVRNGRDLVTIGKPGYAGTDAALEEEIRRLYLGGFPRVEIRGRAVFRTGQPAQLQVFADSAAGNGPDREPAGHALCAAGLKRAEDPVQVTAGSAAAAQKGAEGPVQVTAKSAAAAQKRAEDPVQVTVRGAVVQKASGRPLEKADLEARLRKTGDSLFVFSSLDIEADESIFLPVSAVNALRRDALEQLKDSLSLTEREGKLPPAEREEAPETYGGSRPENMGTRDGRGSSDRELWALVSDSSQLRAAEKEKCACILIDGELVPSENTSDIFLKKTQIGNKSALKSQRIRYIRVLPPVFRVYEREKIRRMIADSAAEGFSGIMVRTLEELEMAKQMEYDGEIIADSSLYTWNRRSMERIFADCGRIVCSLELNQAGIREAVTALGQSREAGPDGFEGKPDQSTVYDDFVLPVYGRVPMMETAGCVRRTENMCSKKEGFWYLEDRMGKKLPVRCRCGTCSNTIYNAVPLSLHQFAGQGIMRKIPVHLCMFTTETGEQTRRILQFFGRLCQEADRDRESGSGAPASVHADSRRGAKSGKAAGRAKERDGSKARAQKKGESRPYSLNPPFAEFTNGHFKTGAI